MLDALSRSIGPAAPLGRGGHHVTVDTRLSRLAVVVALAVVLVLLALPAMASRALLQYAGLFLLLVTLAQCWNLLAGYAGLVSVGQQAFVGLGGYLLFALVTLGSLDPLLAVPLAGGLAALLAIPVGIVTFRLRGPYFAVSTWVVAEVFRLLLAQWKDLGGGTGMSLPKAVTSSMAGLDLVGALFGVRSAAARDIILYWAALVLAIGTIALVYALLRSRLGLALAAVRDEEEAAESVGVGATALKFRVFVIAAFGAGLAGALIFLQKGRISPDAAFSVLDWTAYVIFIVVIGGIGTIEGPIVGALLFVLLQATLADLGPWYLMLLGTLAIAVMLVAPAGLWGTVAKRLDVHLFPIRRRLTTRPDP